MDIPISKQVSATYARNHFKEVTEKALEEGECFIFRKSQPVTVVLSITQYQKLQKAERPKDFKKMSLEELRENSTFGKYVGCLKDLYPGKTALDIQHEWYKMSLRSSE